MLIILSAYRLLDLSILEKFDTQKMYKIYDDWPGMAKNAYEKDYGNLGYSGIDHIVFIGMGGSGAIGDIFSAILSRRNIHVSIVKGYTLPKTVDENTLVIVTSISGNTVETLTALDSAQKLECKIIAFSSGGKMMEFCKEREINYHKIPLIHSPRASFPNFLYAMLKILESILPIEKTSILESITQLEKLKKEIFSGNKSDNNSSIKLAKWIEDIPLLYYPWGLQAASIRFKNSLQENAKMHVISEDIIEACHNGIVAWEKKSKVKPILIQGPNDFIKTKERWDIVKEFFKEKEIDYWEIKSIEGDILTKLITLIYFFDYTSIYKAVLTNIDPSPIKPIDFVKNRLE